MQNTTKKLTCLSCRWCIWDWKGCTTMCERARPEYPDKCELFEYEAGTDEAEHSEGC